MQPRSFPGSIHTLAVDGISQASHTFLSTRGRWGIPAKRLLSGIEYPHGLLLSFNPTMSKCTGNIVKVVNAKQK